MKSFLLLLTISCLCACQSHDTVDPPHASVPRAFVGNEVYLGMSEVDLKKSRTLVEGDEGYIEPLPDNRYFGAAYYWCRHGTVYRVTLMGKSQTSRLPAYLIDTLTDICRSTYGSSYRSIKNNFFGDTSISRVWAVGKGKYAILGYGVTSGATVKVRPDSFLVSFDIGLDSTGWRSVNSAEELLK